MFPPVVTQPQTYGVTLSPVCRAYTGAVRNTPDMQAWTQAAMAEPPPGEVPA